LVNLQSLILTSNLLEGQFPDVDLMQLTDVEISGNSFTGSPSFGYFIYISKLEGINIAQMLICVDPTLTESTQPRDHFSCSSFWGNVNNHVLFTIMKDEIQKTA
jgi:hypothetical protein